MLRHVEMLAQAGQGVVGEFFNVLVRALGGGLLEKRDVHLMRPCLFIEEMLVKFRARVGGNLIHPHFVHHVNRITARNALFLGQRQQLVVQGRVRLFQFLSVILDPLAFAFLLRHLAALDFRQVGLIDRLHEQGRVLRNPVKTWLRCGVGHAGLRADGRGIDGILLFLLD